MARHFKALNLLKAWTSAQEGGESSRLNYREAKCAREPTKPLFGA